MISKFKWQTLVLCLLAFSSVEALEPATKALKTVSERFQEGQVESPSFRLHVVPLLGRMGCSGRACHGAFKGQGGFQLSLFGYNFKKDHEALMGGDDPRIELDDTEESLILLKPTGLEKHGGKKIMRLDSWQYNILKKWIAEGAKDDSKAVGEFKKLEVIPQEIIFKKPGQTVQLKVFAHWSDGKVEDVTQIARFRTNDDAVATVSPEGLITSKSRGDTHVVAFYDNGITPIPVMYPITDLTGKAYPKVKTSTEVDRLVVEKLKKIGVTPSEKASDAEFLRRVTLDVTGSLPAPKDIESFLTDRSPDKRKKKIDELLESPAYAAWWTTKVCDVTGNNARNQGDNLYRDEFSRQWYDWVYKRVDENMPYDKIVEGIVLASSRKEDQNYEDFTVEMSSYLRDKKPQSFADRPDLPHYWSRRNMRKPEEKALNFSYAFLGVRLQCAQCHKHPFDQWSQEDFKHFQAFFEPIQYGYNREQDRNQFLAVQKDFGAGLGMEMGMNGPNMKNMSAEDKRKTRKQLEEEFKKRVAQGKSAPWKEVYVQRSKLYDPDRNKSSKRGKKYKKRKSRGNRVLTPVILGGEEVVTAQFRDSRIPLMEWLKDSDNPYFARSFVNRVWANYFGRGIIEPADDMNLANPPSNEKLLAHLEQGFIKNNYDIKWLHREILNSDTYQRSWKPNKTNKLDKKNFSHASLRRIEAEVVMDILDQATCGSQDQKTIRAEIEKRSTGPAQSKYRNRNAGYGLTIFGKPARQTTCDCERSNDPTLLQTIYTRNDDDLWKKIENPKGWLGEIAKAEGETLNTVKNYKARASQRKKRNQEMKKAWEQLKKLRGVPGKTAAKKRQKIQKRLELLRSGKDAKSKKKRASSQPMPKPEELVREAFLRTVSRPPSAKELALGVEDLKKADSLTAGTRDLLWALLNTKEFILNH